jgi:outer membrane receptor protein involved in Fe transport
MAGAAGGAVLSPVTAPAQEDEEEKQLDRITVTGSRISRVDIEGANPVTILDRDDLKRTGITDLGEVLQDLPMMSGSPTSSQRNNWGDGRVAVDIRGLGTVRTLVLVNGHRMPSLRNDFSMIPMVMVERVEILKDGASAIYGADAIAGVVNIITRRDFEGAEFEFQLGESFDLGGTNYSTSFITGGNSKRGNFVVGVEYTEQEENFLAAYDEPYLQHAVTVYDPNEFHEYGFSGEPWTDLDGNGPGGWGTFGSSRMPYGRFDLRLWNPEARDWTICQDSAGGGSLTTDYGPRNPFPGGCGPGTWDFAPVNYLQTPYQRTSVFFQANYELFDRVDAYLEGHFANRRSEQLLAPQPYDSRFDPSYADIEPGVAISKDNYYNPFGVDVLSWRRRMIEAGGRSFNQDVNQWQVIVGLQGELGATWLWDLSYNYGTNLNAETTFGQLNGFNLANALGPSFLDPLTGEVVCGTPDSPIPDCVSINAFSNPDTNPITDEMLAGLAIALNNKQVTERTVTTFTMSGDLFEMPAGPMAAAFGLERRKEGFEFTPDSLQVAQQVTGWSPFATTGAYEVDSLFTEINIPILSGVTGAELLEIGISARYDDFSIYDSSTTFQGSLRWQPVRSLLLRATAGTVYREPNVSEIFFGGADTFSFPVDPCSGIGGTPGGVPGSGECEDVPPDYVQPPFGDEVRTILGGNPGLQPEEGDTVTVGLAWSPEFLPGFSVTLDWWRIEIEDAIGYPWDQAVLDGCFSGSVPQFCDSFTRFGPQSPDHGALDTIFVYAQNVGPEDAEGIDWSANYTLNSGIGLWNFSWFGTHNISRNMLLVKDFNGDGVQDVEVGDVVGLFEHRSLLRAASYPEWRWRFDLDWSMGDWSLSFSTEFIDGVTECGSPIADERYATMFCPDDSAIVSVDPADTYWGIPLEDRAWLNTTDDMYYFDLVARYTVPGWGSQISAGITNLTDEMLPFLNQGWNATTDEDTYRGLGRRWFVNFKHSF